MAVRPRPGGVSGTPHDMRPPLCLSGSRTRRPAATEAGTGTNSVPPPVATPAAAPAAEEDAPAAEEDAPDARMLE